MTQYDSIFLGSSPLMMMSHAALCKKENSLLIEQSDRMGGAWYTSELWGINNLEVGCHILKNYQKGFELLQKSQLLPDQMQIPPKTLYRTRKGESFMNSLKINFLLLSKTFSKSKLLEMYRVDKIGNLFKKNEIQPYFYFNGGCQELVSGLNKTDCNISQNSITEISVSNGKALLKLKDGSSLSTSKLYLPKNYKTEKFQIENKSISYEYENYVSEHYVFLFEKEIDHISFVDVVGDDLINLISNVGLYTDTKGKGVLCISIKKSNGVQENNLSVRTYEDMPTDLEQSQLAREIHNKLLDFGIIEESNKLLKSHYEPYVLNVKKNKSAYDLSKLSNGTIEEFDTSDLILSMISNPILNGTL